MNLYNKKHAWVLGGFEFLRADTTVEADPGSGGASFAADAAAGGELHPYAKMEFGASGTQTPVSAANPLPVVQTGTPGLPTGAATAARQDTGNTALAAIQTAVEILDNTVSGSEMQVDIVSSAAIPVTDNSGSLTVDDGGASLTVDAPVGTPVFVRLSDGASAITTLPVSAASLPLPTGAATSAAQDTGNASLATLAGAVSGTEMQVDIVASAAIPVTDNGGTLSIDDGGGAITVDGTVGVSGTVTLAASTGTQEVVGDVAHDAAAAGNPVLVAARANANEPTAVADADSTYLWADLFGRLVVLPGHPSPEAPATVNATSSGNTTVIAAPGANVSLYICKGSIHNSGSANITAILQDGAGGTARWAAELAAEGGGSVFDFGSRGWKLTANTLLNVNLSGAGDVRVNITEYYIAA